jgi:hypothetical protein
MNLTSPALAKNHTLQAKTSVVALETSEKQPLTHNGAKATLVTDLIAEKSLPEIFGVLGLVSDCATREKLLADLPLLPWYPPGPSEGGIWREE